MAQTILDDDDDSDGADVSIDRIGFNAFSTRSLIIRKEFPETFIWDVLNEIDRFVPSQS